MCQLKGHSLSLMTLQYTWGPSTLWFPTTRARYRQDGWDSSILVTLRVLEVQLMGFQRRIITWTSRSRALRMYSSFSRSKLNANTDLVHYILQVHACPTNWIDGARTAQGKAGTHTRVCVLSKLLSSSSIPLSLLSWNCTCKLRQRESERVI